MTRAAALRAAAARLAGASASPRLDAELLMAHAGGISREALLLAGLNEAAPAGFEALVARREAGEPIAYIIGQRDFWTITLAVRPGVLIPRPDSETLIEAAVSHFGEKGPRTVLDLGTGSGALLLAALAQWPEAVGVGLDISAEALAVARENAGRLGMGARADFRPGSWGGTGAAVDLLLCNPPYIGTGEALPHDVAAYEPAAALYAGADGLDAYRALAPLLARQIAPGGMAALEIGAAQAAAVGALLAAEGLEAGVRRDLAGRTRCLVVRGGAASERE